ncbi:hypothetical protein ERO13_D01G142850v2 [Gossypium hirsutum]|nr:hypothetical protein ERO13_D01G142850v2 [Gossypium hirsutum]
MNNCRIWSAIIVWSINSSIRDIFRHFFWVLQTYGHYKFF